MPGCRPDVERQCAPMCSSSRVLYGPRRHAGHSLSAMPVLAIRSVARPLAASRQIGACRVNAGPVAQATRSACPLASMLAADHPADGHASSLMRIT